MDKRTIFGLMLIGVVLFGFSWYNSKQSEKYAAEKRIADSIAMAEGRLHDQQALQPTEELPGQGSVTALVATDAGNAETPVPAAQETNVTATEAGTGTVTSPVMTEINAASGETPVVAADSAERGKPGDDLYLAQTGEEQFTTVENNVMKITFSNLGGKVSGIELKDYKTYYDEPLQLYAENSSYFDMLFWLGAKSINTGEYYFKYAGTEAIELDGGKTAQRVLMRLHVDSTSYVQYAYTVFEDDYMVDFNVNFVNMDESLSPQQSMLNFSWGSSSPQQEKGFKNENRYSTIAYKYPGDDKSFEEMSMSEASEVEDVKNNVQWIAFKQQYFSTIFTADNNFLNAEIGYDTYVPTKNPENDNVKRFHAQANVAFDSRNPEYGFKFYFGPNKYSLLKTYDMGMERLVPLGWSVVRWVNKWLVIPVFDFLSKHIGSFGIIILLLTLMIKILILPLTYKSYLSMAKMKLLKPEIDAIGAKYPNKEDALKKQQATMALYKQAGVSPMGGCIPMLIQFPVIVALFFFLPAAIELRGESFLWAEDLSTYDSILDLPFSIPFYGDHISLFTLLMAGSMLLSTKFNPQTAATSGSPGAGSMKFLMTYLMPVMLLLWFNNYASGLSYYYLLSNLFTIVQQWGFKFFISDEKLHAQMKANASKNSGKAAKKPKSKWQQRYEEMMKAREQQARQQQKRR